MAGIETDATYPIEGSNAPGSDVAAYGSGDNGGRGHPRSRSVM